LRKKNYDLRFSKTVPERIKKAKGIPVMMQVGNPYYKKALKELGGIMGAEFSGHIMYAENNNADDGLYATLKTLKLMCERKDKLSNLIDSVKEYEASPEESMEAKTPDTVFERVINEFPDAKQVELDGVYLDFTSGFISVRRSQTEPNLFRIRVEAKNKEELDSRVQKVRNIVKEG
jgi:phosphomannomutase/phosphoglucomutase